MIITLYVPDIIPPDSDGVSSASMKTPNDSGDSDSARSDCSSSRANPVDHQRMKEVLDVTHEVSHPISLMQCFIHHLNAMLSQMSSSNAAEIGRLSADLSETVTTMQSLLVSVVSISL
jgi:hypothetical protein